MSERVTRASLDERCANLNRRMAQRGAHVRYTVGHRYDYYAIDRCDTSGMVLSGPVVAGTKRELADWLHAGMVVLDDAEIYADR